MLEPRMSSPPLAASPVTEDSLSGTGRQPKRSRLARYGVAAGFVAVAFLARLALFGELDNRLPFAFFLPAAIIAAWYGGLGPGLFATAAGLLLGDYFFLPPHNALGPVGGAERTAIVIFSGTSTLTVLLIDNLHSRIERLESALRARSRDEGSSGVAPTAGGNPPH